jgi:hypothetical protein
MKIKTKRPYQFEKTGSIGRKQVHCKRSQGFQKQPRDNGHCGTPLFLRLHQGIAEMVYDLILIFRFKSGKNFTPFFQLPDNQGIGVGEILQAEIFVLSVSSVGLLILLYFFQKFTDNDTAPRAFSKWRVRCAAALWAF